MRLASIASCAVLTFILAASSSPTLATGKREVQDLGVIAVDFKVVKKGGGHAVALVLTNKSAKAFVGYHPHLQMATGFVVSSKLGNVIEPEGVAKVSPKRQRLRLAPGAKKTVWLKWSAATRAKGLTFPFLSGSVLFAYRLKKGVTYRVIAIYRPKGHQSRRGFTSAERQITLR